MELERKKVLEKVGTSTMISFILFILLTFIRFNKETNSFLIFRSLINPISIFIGFSSLFGIHVADFFKDLIKETKRIKLKYIILFLKYVFIYQGIIILTTNLNLVQELNSKIKISRLIDLYINITMLLFVLFEEYIFRYLLQTKLMKVCDDYGILFMSVVFGIFHYGKFKSGFLFGIVVGIIYVITENIAYTVLIHYFLNSTLSLRMVVFLQNLFMATNIQLDEVNKITGVISILLGVLLIIMQLLLKSDYAYQFIQKEKELLKRIIYQIIYLPELIMTSPLNLVLLFRFFIFIQKFIY